jgi:Ca2+-binding EF-hand superfamily protein
MNTDFKTLIEKQLKEKINQKANDKLSDEAYVIKAMKFFDIYNTGNVTYEQFHKGLEKIGVYYTFDELLPIFPSYDPEGTGKVDYIEFSKYLFNSKVPKPHQRKITVEELRLETAELLNYIRRTLAGRAGNGLISLRRIFNIIDKDRSGTISIAEFSSIMREFKIELSCQQINNIFKIFDLNRDGSLSYEEFMTGIRGRMNEFRIFLVNKAFDKFDPDNTGFADLHTVVSSYDATRHPAVVEGRKTEEQVLAEFLDTFEVHHNLSTGGPGESRISREEFNLYYENISATIGDDEYFANVLDATWDISNTASAPTHEGTWTDKSKYGDELSPAYSYKNTDPKDLKSPTLRSGLESSDNPWHTLTPYYQVETADRRSIASQYKHRIPRDHTQITGEESKDHLFNTKVIDIYDKYLEVNKKPLDAPRQAPTFTKRRDYELSLERFKGNVIQRGTRGIIGLKRQFKILDDNNDGTLDIQDFQKGLADYKVEIELKDLEKLYEVYNIPGTTSIDYVGLI